MADIKISDMTVATGFVGSAIAPIVESGVNKKVSAVTFWSNIQDPVIVNAANENNDLTVKGVTDNELLFVDASANKVGISTNAPTTTLDVDGSLRVNGVYVNASKNVQTTPGTADLTTDATVIDSVSPVTLQLNVATFEGQLKTIYKKGLGTLSVNPGPGASIAGASSVSLDTSGSSLTLQSFSSIWYIKSMVLCTIS